MTIRNLDRLLAPRSVALIGASPTPGSIGRIVAENLHRGGFHGEIHLVNPRHQTIDGRRCWPSVAALPCVPDLAVIATPAATVPGLVAELGAKGCRAAVVVTAGVTGALRQEMLDASRPHLLRIQGPNCLGLMLPAIGLDASFGHRLPPAGDLALVSQSGAIVTALVDWVSSRGIGLSHVISLGDMADVDFGDLLDYLAGDVSSRAILIYMEQLTAARKFMSAARRAARAKPVIVLKAGRNPAGARAAMSHTGAMAGSDAAYDAAFQRAGLVRVRELEELFEAAEILSRLPRLDGERLMLLTNGGGAGVLAADHLADLQGTLAELPDGTSIALDAVLPPMWSKGNPVDIIGDADAERYARALDILLDHGRADALLIMNCPTALASSSDIARRVVELVTDRRRTKKQTPPLLTCWLGAEAAAPARAMFAGAGIASFETPAAAVQGFMHLVRHSRAQTALIRTPPLASEPLFDPAAVRAVIETAQAAGRTTLSEIETKALLQAYAIPVTQTSRARTPEEAATAAAAVLATSAACVVKIVSPDIPHKTEVGGVRLGIRNPQEARTEAAAMAARVARLRPDAVIEGFAVQPLVAKPRAHELFLGASEDPTFGPMLMFGAGGTAVEVVRDVVQALPPVDANLAADMIRDTRVGRLLAGYRDRPAANLGAITAALVNLGTLVLSHPEIRELDVNPLLADESSIIALDARARISLPSHGPRAPAALRPYPGHWQADAKLRDGTRVHIRPIRPADEHLYDRFLARVDAHDRRMRFFVAAPQLSHRFIARLTQIDYAREMAFVAIEGEGGGIAGVARMIADPDYRRAEFAILLTSDRKRLGLGLRLMRQLIDYARAEGLAELYGEVLAENEAMISLCRKLGFQSVATSDDPTLRQVTLTL